MQNQNGSLFAMIAFAMSVVLIGDQFSQAVSQSTQKLGEFLFRGAIWKFL
jgi:hypothetical protein